MYYVVEEAGRRLAAAREKYDFQMHAGEGGGGEDQALFGRLGVQTMEQACVWPPTDAEAGLRMDIGPSIQGTNMVVATVSQRRGPGMTTVAVAKGSWREYRRTDGPMADWRRRPLRLINCGCGRGGM